MYKRQELERALDVAASYDRRILVEVGVTRPVEINCAALGYGEDVRASVCEMPVPSSNDTFLDFWQKYLRNAKMCIRDSSYTGARRTPKPRSGWAR